MSFELLAERVVALQEVIPDNDGILRKYLLECESALVTEILSISGVRPIKEQEYRVSKHPDGWYITDLDGNTVLKIKNTIKDYELVFVDSNGRLIRFMCRASKGEDAIELLKKSHPNYRDIISLKHCP